MILIVTIMEKLMQNGQVAMKELLICRGVDRGRTTNQT